MTTIDMSACGRCAVAVILALTISAHCRPFISESQAATTSSATIGARSDKSTTHTGEGSGELVAMSEGKRLGLCPLKHTDVKVEVSGYVARVSVKQTFSNSYSKKIEARYTFPLPEHAAVDEMTMRIGKRTIKGLIKKREEAEQIFERARNN